MVRCVCMLLFLFAYLIFYFIYFYPLSTVERRAERYQRPMGDAMRVCLIWACVSSAHVLNTCPRPWYVHMLSLSRGHTRFEREYKIGRTYACMLCITNRRNKCLNFTGCSYMCLFIKWMCWYLKEDATLPRDRNSCRKYVAEQQTEHQGQRRFTRWQYEAIQVDFPPYLTTHT